MNKIKIPSSIKLKIKKKGTSSLSHTPSPTSITFWKSPKRNKEQIISKFTTLKWTPIWKSYCFTCKEKKVLRSLNFTLHAWVTIWLYIFKYLFIAWNTETNYVLGLNFVIKLCYRVLLIIINNMHWNISFLMLLLYLFGSFIGTACSLRRS